MTFLFIDVLLVAAHRLQEPSAEAWGSYLDAVRRGAFAVQLVASGGGGPTGRSGRR